MTRRAPRTARSAGDLHRTVVGVEVQYHPWGGPAVEIDGHGAVGAVEQRQFGDGALLQRLLDLGTELLDVDVADRPLGAGDDDAPAASGRRRGLLVVAHYGPPSLSLGHIGWV